MNTDKDQVHTMGTRDANSWIRLRYAYMVYCSTIHLSTSHLHKPTHRRQETRLITFPGRYDPPRCLHNESPPLRSIHRLPNTNSTIRILPLRKNNTTIHPSNLATPPSISLPHYHTPLPPPQQVSTTTNTPPPSYPHLPHLTKLHISIRNSNGYNVPSFIFFGSFITKNRTKNFLPRGTLLFKFSRCVCSEPAVERKCG